jgi:hypothetical protein
LHSLSIKWVEAQQSAIVGQVIESKLMGTEALSDASPVVGIADHVKPPSFVINSPLAI